MAEDRHLFRPVYFCGKWDEGCVPGCAPCLFTGEMAYGLLMVCQIAWCPVAARYHIKANAKKTPQARCFRECVQWPGALLREGLTNVQRTDSSLTKDKAGAWQGQGQILFLEAWQTYPTYECTTDKLQKYVPCVQNHKIGMSQSWYTNCWTIRNPTWFRNIASCDKTISNQSFPATATVLCDTSYRDQGPTALAGVI